METLDRAVQPQFVRRRTQFEALKLHWRCAFDAADAALQTAPDVLPADLLRDRRTRLNGERTATASLLAVLAHDFGLDW